MNKIRLSSIILVVISFSSGYIFNNLVDSSSSSYELKKARILHTKSMYDRLVLRIVDNSYFGEDMQDLLSRRDELRENLIKANKESRLNTIQELSNNLDAALVVYGEDISELKEPIEKALADAAVILYD